MNDVMYAVAWRYLDNSGAGVLGKAYMNQDVAIRALDDLVKNDTTRLYTLVEFEIVHD